MQRFSITTAALVLCLVLGPSASFARTKGSGRVVDDPRSVAEFSSVEVGSGLHAQISGGAQSVTVQVDDNLKELIETVVDGGVLRVRVREREQIDPSRRVEIRIVAPRLSAIGLSGGASGTADVPVSETFKLGLSGGAVLESATIATEHLLVEGSGGARGKLDGKAKTMKVRLSGGSVLKSSLPAEEIEVSASGGAELHATATRSLRGSASGGATLEIAGAPAERSVRTSGGAAVHYGK